MASIEFPAALGLAGMDPVGGAVAGAVEARGFAEGLQQEAPDAPALRYFYDMYYQENRFVSAQT